MSEYELSANPVKTEIINVPTEFEKDWVAIIRSREVIALAEKTKRQVVIDYFNFILTLQKQYPSEQIIPYALARIEEKSVLLDDKELFYSLLLNLVTHDSSAVKWTLNFINLDTSVIGHLFVKNLFVKTVPKYLRDFSSRGRHNDVLWCLILCYIFSVKVSKTLSELVYQEGNSLVKLMCLDLARLKYMDLEVELTPKSDDFWGEDWILNFTVFTQDVFEEFRGKSKITANPFFKLLQKTSVRFYTPFLDNPIDDDLNDYISNLCEKVRDSEYKVEIDGEMIDPTRNDIQTCSRCGERFISEELGVCSTCWEYVMSND